MEIILRLNGANRDLSNYAESPVYFDDEVYPTVENAFQAAKLLDRDARSPFKTCSPAFAIKLGRRVIIRNGWDQSKVAIMRGLLKQKYTKGSEFASILLATGDAYLCDGNDSHDNYWGVCLCKKCENVKHRNILGQLLMQIREELKAV